MKKLPTINEMERFVSNVLKRELMVSDYEDSTIYVFYNFVLFHRHKISPDNIQGLMLLADHFGENNLFFLQQFFASYFIETENLKTDFFFLKGFA